MVFRRLGQTLAVMLMVTFIVSCSVNPTNGGSSVSSSSSSESSSISSISSSSSSSDSSVSSSESSSSSSSAVVPESEPNGSQTDADSFEVSTVATNALSGSLSSSSDEDWYSFNITVENPDLTWCVSCETAVTSDILTFYVYRQVVSGDTTNLTALNGSGYETGNTAEIVPVGTGTYTYYLKIVSYNGNVGDYSVKVWQDSPYGSILKRFFRELLK